MATTQTFETIIKLNSQEAKNQLEQLRKKVDDLKAACDKAIQSKQDSSFIKDINKELKAARSELRSYETCVSKTIDTVSGLANSSVRDIKQAMRDLEYSLKLVNEQLRGAEQGSEEYKKLVDSAKQLKTQIAAVNEEQKASRSLWSRTIDWLNANWGAVTQLMSMASGLSFTMRKCTNAFAEMNQEMYNVTKYMGQPIGQVEEMNEDFKKLNTRTSRIELNLLAEAAGRLGIQSKEQIEEFVDAADKINVALGDDLGTRAVGVLSSVASHLDQVREAQQTAAQSYKDGTSVINEFNVQNQTVQAEPDKAKKAFIDLCVDLGEKLCRLPDTPSRPRRLA